MDRQQVAKEVKIVAKAWWGLSFFRRVIHFICVEPTKEVGELPVKQQIILLAVSLLLAVAILGISIWLDPPNFGDLFGR